MNLRKISLKITILFIVMIVIAGVLQKVNAETDLSSHPVYFGIRNLRDSGWGYAIGDPMNNGEKGNSANIWDIQKFESLNSKGENVNAYCIKAGVGFSNTNNKKEYKVSYDFKKEKDQIIALNSNVLKSVVLGGYYNNILAMVDLFYLKGISTEEEKHQLLQDAGCYKELEGLEELEEVNLEGYIITDDEIEAIQQAALWYYTNHEDSKYDKTDDNDAWFTYTTNERDYDALMNYEKLKGKGRLRATQAISLYKYLINQAAQNAQYYENGTAKSRTKITLYTSKEALESTQPVIIIEREKGKFDLALRKYITKVTTDGNTVELKENASRIPVIDESPLEEGTEKTTAAYKHKKDPVEVKTGSVVTYKITIYNEGEVAGRATKIVDQLPTGLKFLKVINGNFKEDPSSTYNEAGTNTLNLIRKEENTNNLPAYKSGNLIGGTGSETIEIECQVTRSSWGKRYYFNKCSMDFRRI